MLSSSQQKLNFHFKSAVKNDSLRQCYIIKGEKRLGKKYVTQSISEYIMCENGDACGKCNSCLSLKAFANPDVYKVSNGDKKTIEVDKIRALIKEVYIKPVMGKYKLFIIENAHLMDAPPQNALLKVIEEPPPYAVFVLICDNLNTILPTILSRAHVLSLDAWTLDELKSVHPLLSEDEYMYTYSMGNIGLLKSVSSDEDFKYIRNGVIEGFVKMMLSDETALYEALDFWLKNKDYKESMINILVMFVRDVMLFKNSLRDEIANTGKLREIQSVSDKVTAQKSYNMLCIANDALRKMGKYGNFGMAAHALLMQLGQT